MSQININPVELITIAIPGEKNTTVELTLPPYDATKPSDSKNIHDICLEKGIEGGVFLVREMLKYYNSSAKAIKAIDSLGIRQLIQIDREMEKYNEVELTLGESNVSEKPSSETEN